MNVLIVEDEKLASDRLIKLIKEYNPAISIADRIDSIKDTVSFLKHNKDIDLIFMDIQLADGLSFEIFEEQNIDTPIIFTTAYNHYALKAFQVNSVDYLLKPIGIKELTSALDKFKNVKYLYNSINSESAQNIKNPLQEEEEKQRFVVKVGAHLQSIPIESICCFFSKEKISFIYTQSNKKYPVDFSLDQIEGMVSPKLFFRINRKFIVNINCIHDITNYSNSRLKLILKQMQEEEIIVSREKVSSFKTWLDS